MPIQPLTEDQKSYLMILINRSKGINLDELGFMIKAAEDAGYITAEEAKTLLYETVTKDYEEVMLQFREKYGFRPRLVASWQEGIAFDAPQIIPYGIKAE